MPRLARMPWLISTLTLFAVGCGEMPSPFTVADRSPKSDADAPFDPPNTYPEWAYDAPSYVRPAEELIPEPKVNANDPLHYFTKDRVILIRKPEGYTPEETPRVAIWWTDNNGFHWNKAGYFGRTQSYFAFEVEEDGDYGIRFVGPGQDAAIHSLPYPERVYHADSTLPEVEVTIMPEQTWYHVGDEITINWKASDYHLIEKPVRIGMLLDFTADGVNATELERDLPDEGSMTFKLPAEALDHEVRIRADALDRAGNLGIAISFALQVVPVESEEPLLEGEPMPEDGMTANDQPAPTSPTPMPTAAIGPNGGLVPPGTSPDAFKPATHKGTSSLPYASSAARKPESPMEWSAGATGTSLKTDGNVKPTIVKAPVPPPTSTTPGQKPIGIADAPQADPNGDGLSPEEPYEQNGQMIEVLPGSSPSSSDDGAKEPSAAAPIELEPEDFIIAAAPPRGLEPLLAPMPATVNQESAFASATGLHPWRSLNQPTAEETLQTVWLLPRPQFLYEVDRMFDGRFLTENEPIWAIAEPGTQESTFVSLPEAALDEEPVAVP